MVWRDRFTQPLSPGGHWTSSNFPLLLASYWSPLRSPLPVHADFCTLLDRRTRTSVSSSHCQIAFHQETGTAALPLSRCCSRPEKHTRSVVPSLPVSLTTEAYHWPFLFFFVPLDLMTVVVWFPSFFSYFSFLARKSLIPWCNLSPLLVQIYYVIFFPYCTLKLMT